MKILQPGLLPPIPIAEEFCGNRDQLKDVSEISNT